MSSSVSVPLFSVRSVVKRSSRVAFLKETPVPLRVYGKWQELNYTLQVDQLLRKHLQDEAKRRLNDWADRNKDTRNGKDVKKLLNKL